MENLNTDEKSDAQWAYVKYRKDGHRAYVPSSFIEFDFKEKQPKQNTMYWVFWSSIANDSPADMMKRRGVDEIPHIENDDQTEEAAYYRATISCVKGSLEELKDSIIAKRVKETPGAFLEFPSFEESLMDKKKSDKSDKPKKSKNSSRSSANKKKTHRPSSASAADKKESHSADVHSQTQAKQTSKALFADEFNIPDDPKLLCFEKSESEKVLEKQTKSGRIKGLRPAAKRSFVESSSEQEDDSDKEDSLFKVVSPTKYYQAKAERDFAQDELRVIRQINTKLQTRLLDALEENDNLKRKLKQLDQVPHCPAVKRISPNHTCSTPSAASDKSGISLPEFSISPVSNKSSDTRHETTATLSSAATDESYSEIAGDVFCPDVIIQETSEGSFRTDVTPELASSKIPEGWKWPNLPASYEVMPGLVIPSDRLASDFWCMEAGKRGDSMFCKNAASFIFTDDVIATKKVVGKKEKPASKKPKGCPGDEPSTSCERKWTPESENLNPAGLVAIRDFLIFRVKAEGDELKDPERTSQATVNYYIQQKKKTLKSAGYPIKT